VMRQVTAFHSPIPLRYVKVPGSCFMAAAPVYGTAAPPMGAGQCRTVATLSLSIVYAACSSLPSTAHRTDPSYTALPSTAPQLPPMAAGKCRSVATQPE
jgi:prepilin signal peptidase PulO-like enzyme (type II secretory pathway)